MSAVAPAPAAAAPTAVVVTSPLVLAAGGASGSAVAAPVPRRKKAKDKCNGYRNVMMACCGCRKSKRDIQSGLSGEKRYGFLQDAAGWNTLYVPQDNAGTAKNITEAGGIEGMLKALKSDPTKGIEGSDDDITQRQEQFGVNAFPEPPLQSWWSIFWQTLQDIILIILMVSAAISITIGTIESPDHGWADGLAILAAVIIVGGVTATNDFQKQLKFLELSKESAGMVEVRVLRANQETTVNPVDVVVGDIVLVSGSERARLYSTFPRSRAPLPCLALTSSVILFSLVLLPFLPAARHWLQAPRRRSFDSRYRHQV